MSLVKHRVLLTKKLTKFATYTLLIRNCWSVLLKSSSVPSSPHHSGVAQVFLDPSSVSASSSTSSSAAATAAAVKTAGQKSPVTQASKLLGTSQRPHTAFNAASLIGTINVWINQSINQSIERLLSAWIKNCQVSSLVYYTYRTKRGDEKKLKQKNCWAVQSPWRQSWVCECSPESVKAVRWR